MKSLLSLYFNDDRIYIALLKNNDLGNKISYINSTKDTFDFLNPDNLSSASAIMELKTILEDVKYAYDECYITLAPKNFLFSFIPNVKEDQKLQKQLIELEFEHTFNGFKIEDFSIETIPMKIIYSNKDMLLLSLLHKEYFEMLNNLLPDLKINKIIFNQKATLNSFLYNYPEKFSNNTILFSINKDTLNIFITQNRELLYYNEYPYKSSIEDLCLKFISEIESNISKPIHNAFFMGNLLNKELLLKLTENLNPFFENILRFNTFRMIHSELTERQNRYCSRVAHLLAPCIGAVLPNYLKDL